MPADPLAFDTFAFGLKSRLDADVDPPEDRARLSNLLDDYNTTVKAEGREPFSFFIASETDKARKTMVLFEDDEVSALKTDYSGPDPKGHKQRTAIILELSRRSGRSIADTADALPGLRDFYAKAYMNKDAATDAEIFGHIGQTYKLDGIIGKSGVESGLMGKPWPEAFASSLEEIKKSPAYHPAKGWEYMMQFAAANQETSARRGPYQRVITAGAENLQALMGVSGAAAPDMDFNDIANMLMEVPKADRKFVLEAIALQGATTGADKDAFKKLGENIWRGSKDLATKLDKVIVRDELLRVERDLKITKQFRTFQKSISNEDDAARAVWSSVIGAGLIPLSALAPGIGSSAGVKSISEDERKLLMEAAVKFREKLQLSSEIDVVAEGGFDPETKQFRGIDPATSSSDWPRGIYSASRSLPMTVATFLPAGIGQALMLGQFSEDNYQELKRQFPEMSDEQAHYIGIAASPFQTVTETIVNKAVAGMLPSFMRFSSAPAVTWAALAKEIGVGLPSGVALEMGEEFTQDLTPYFVMHAVRALGDDVQEVPWVRIFSNLKRNAGETFRAVVPMVLVMNGGANIIDFSNGRSLASYPLKLQAAGLSEASAVKISEAAKAGDWRKAQDLMRAEWKAGRVETDGAKLEAQREAAATAQLSEEQRLAMANVQLEAAGVIPTLRQTTPGKWRMELRDEAGSTLDFDSFESAHQARNAVIEERGINLHESVRQYIETADRNAGVGRAYDWEFNPEQRSLRRAVNEGEVSEAAANRRVGISDVVVTEKRQKPGQEEDADFEVANATMEATSQTADDRLASTYILGSNKTEFREGIHRTVVKLYAGATALTVVEEKVEGDADVMLAQGKRDWMIQKLRSYEQQSGDKLFTTQDDSQLKNDDVREAWSHFAVSYFAGKSKRDQSLPDAWKAKGFRKVIADTMRSGMGGVMTGYASFFRSVFRRAAKIGKVRRDGKLDADFEMTIARSLGLEQQVHEAGVAQEAANMAESLSAAATGVVPELDQGYELDPDNAPFAIMPLGPGNRPISTAPAILEKKAFPFADDRAGTDANRWRATWKDWVSGNRSHWRQVVEVAEGPIALSAKTEKEVGQYKRSENIGYHFEAAARLPELLKNSVLASVEPYRGPEAAAEIHKRYAWMEMSDGSLRHVLMTVIRWTGEKVTTDSAYSVEAIEVQSNSPTVQNRAAGETESTPSVSEGETLPTWRDSEPSLQDFLSGIKPEHRFKNVGHSVATGGLEGQQNEAQVSLEAAQRTGETSGGSGFSVISSGNGSGHDARGNDDALSKGNKRGRQSGSGSSEKGDRRGDQSHGAAQLAFREFFRAVRERGLKFGHRWGSQLEFVDAVEAQEQLIQEIWPDSNALAETLIAEAKASNFGVQEGNEHRMWVVHRDGEVRAVKITLFGAYGTIIESTPLDYMRRLAEVNAFAPSLDIKIVGLAKTPSGYGMVTDSAYIVGKHPSKRALEMWLDKGGFALTEPSSKTWTNANGESLHDVKPENFMQTKGGMVPIDVAITSKRITDFVEGRTTSFSVVTGTLDQRIAKMFDPFHRSPELRARLGLEMQQRANRLRNDWEAAMAANRTRAEIKAQRKTMEDQLFHQKSGGITPDMADIQSHPILSEVWGRAVSRSEAKKRKVINEYDDAPLLPRAFYGGTRTPDQLAQELHDKGLLPDAYPATMWAQIEAAYSMVSKNAETIKTAQREAKEESRAWAESAKKAADSPVLERARLLAALRTLDAIISALPSEIRGKIGGYVQIAKYASDESRLEVIEERTRKIDEELEKFMKKDFTKQFEKILDRAESKGKPGEKAKGNLGAETHRFFDRVKGVWDAEQDAVNTQLAAAEGIIADPIVSDEAREEAFERWTALHQFGAFSSRSATEMDTALQNAKRILKEGREGWKAIMDARAEERKALRQDAMQEAGGTVDWTAAQVQADNESRRGQLQRAADWFNRHYSFQQVLTTIFGEGAISQRYENRARAATRQKTDAMRQRITEYRDAMMQVFGARSWRDAQRRLFDLQQRVTDAPVTFYGESTVRRREAPADIVKLILDGKAQMSDYDITRDWTQGDLDQMERLYQENERLPPNKQKGMLSFETINHGLALPKGALSQFEAMHFSMLAKQEQYRKAMERHGITEDTLSDIETWLTPEAKAIRQWLFNQYEAGYAPLNEVYSRMFGVDLPRVKQYAPGYFDTDGKQTEVDPFGSGMEATGLAAGFLKKRKNHLARPVQVDAMQAYWQHTMMTEHWKAWSELSQEMRSVFGNSDVMRTMKARRGSGLANDMLWWVQTLEQNGVRDAQANEWLAKVMRANVRMGLAYKVSVLLKQLPAAFGSVADVSSGAWVRSAGRVLSGRSAVSPLEMFRTATIQRRIESGYSPEMREAMRGPNARPSVTEDILEWGMQRIAWTDAAFTSFSASVAFDAHFTQAKAQGMSDHDARRIALEQTENTVGRTAQPGELMDRSRREVETNGLGKLLFMFQSANRQAFSLVQAAGNAAINGQGSAKKFGKMVFTYHVLVPVIMQTMAGLVRYLFTDDEAEEAWAPEDYLKSMMLGPLSGIMVFGAVAQALGEGLFGTSYGSNRADNPLVEAVSKSYRSVQDFADGDADMKDAGDLASAIGLMLSGFSNSPTEAAGVGWNILKQLLGLADSASSIAEGEK